MSPNGVLAAFPNTRMPFFPPIVCVDVDILYGIFLRFPYFVCVIRINSRHFVRLNRILLRCRLATDISMKSGARVSTRLCHILFPSLLSLACCLSLSLLHVISVANGEQMSVCSTLFGYSLS